MNSSETIGAYWLGALVAVAMFVYPPWVRVEYRSPVSSQSTQGIAISVYSEPVAVSTGYGWLFSPPDSSRIDIWRLLVQLVGWGILVGFYAWFTSIQPAAPKEQAT